MGQKLIFVYNADSGLFNTVTDIAHKLFSPSTYNCQLCAVTHSAFSMRDQWKQFLQSLDCEMEFLHRDEWRAQGHNDVLPAVFLQQGSEVECLLSAEEINQCETMGALQDLIVDRLPK